MNHNLNRYDPINPIKAFISQNKVKTVSKVQCFLSELAEINQILDSKCPLRPETELICIARKEFLIKALELP